MKYIYMSLLFMSVLWLGGCGETPANAPLAGDIVLIRVDTNESGRTFMYADEKVQFVATASYTEGILDRNVTESVKWHSSDTAIAEVSPAGMVTATKKSGTVEIRADYNRFDDTKSIDVYALLSMELVASDINVSREKTIQIKAIGTFDDGSNTKREITFNEKLKWVLTKPDDSNASLEQNGTLYTGDINTTLDINVTRYDINASLKINVI